MNEPKLLGNGEGHTALILLGAETLQLRELLRQICEGAEMVSAQKADVCLTILNRGIQRGTERIKAEFDAELKRRKGAKK